MHKFINEKTEVFPSNQPTEPSTYKTIAFFITLLKIRKNHSSRNTHKTRFCMLIHLSPPSFPILKSLNIGLSIQLPSNTHVDNKFSYRLRVQ